MPNQTCRGIDFCSRRPFTPLLLMISLSVVVTAGEKVVNRQQERRTTAATRNSGEFWSPLPLARRHAATEGDWRFKAVLAGDDGELNLILRILSSWSL
nr:hypothetical protein Iba_scaffold12896CG0030 [Ipomoea batatas]